MKPTQNELPSPQEEVENKGKEKGTFAELPEIEIIEVEGCLSSTGVSYG